MRKEREREKEGLTNAQTKRERERERERERDHAVEPTIVPVRSQSSSPPRNDECSVHPTPAKEDPSHSADPFLIVIDPVNDPLRRPIPHRHIALFVLISLSLKSLSHDWSWDFDFFCFDFCFFDCLYILILRNNICLDPKKMWKTW